MNFLFSLKSCEEKFPRQFVFAADDVGFLVVLLPGKFPQNPGLPHLPCTIEDERFAVRSDFPRFKLL